MRLSKQAIMPVPPKDFWAAIAFAVVLLSGIGLYVTEIQHLPVVESWAWISPWLWGGALIWIWGLTVLQVIRFGWAVFSRQWGILLFGYTLFAGGQLWAHPPAIVFWLSNSGMLMVLAGILLPYMEFGRKGEEAPASPAADKEN